MAKRKKKRVITENIDRQLAAEIFGEYAALHNNLDMITSQMETEMNATRDYYQPRIAETQQKLVEKFELLEHFAKSNPQLFEKVKSIGFTYGRLGFRKGMPALKTLPGKTWKKVLEYLKGTLPEYVEKKFSVKKDELLADREDPKLKDLFPIMGVKVVQDETFYVDLKKEEV